MQIIEVNRIIELRNLDPHEVAEVLFKGNKHPTLALERLRQGDTLLNEQQIKRFAAYLQIPVGDLFNGASWGFNFIDNLHTFKAGDYLARLDMSSHTTHVFHKGRLLGETMVHRHTITLSEYFKQLEELIFDLKNRKDD